nr:hypothetical protein GCM10020093_116890 [Planobispora longispora]
MAGMVKVRSWRPPAASRTRSPVTSRAAGRSRPSTAAIRYGAPLTPRIRGALSVPVTRSRTGVPGRRGAGPGRRRGPVVDGGGRDAAEHVDGDRVVGDPGGGSAAEDSEAGDCCGDSDFAESSSGAGAGPTTSMPYRPMRTAGSDRSWLWYQ